MHKYRSHNCGELRKSDSGKAVRLSGWVHRKRDHGNLLFIDLRDHYGITQIVFNQAELAEQASNIKYETVITIDGTVSTRTEDTVNNSMDTGAIEVLVTDYKIESLADNLPITVNSDQVFPEDTRLKYRFLDLRREKLHKNIVLRANIIAKMRKLMTDLGFVEFQTPILTASSPEGARDYLVPSRVHPGKFYALPQAPQQFKQLLMVSGFDKYFQIAPCFRDEDARADRSPGEFYQLDMEMSFVTQDDIFAVIEPVMYKIFTEFSDKKVAESVFPRISYDEAMLKYGSDKPDLRNPIELADVTDIFRNSSFSIFAQNIKMGSLVRAIPAPGCASKPRSFFDKMIDFAILEGASGLGYIIFDQSGEAKGPIAKFLTSEQLAELKEKCKLQNGDAVFFSCDQLNKMIKIAAKVRDKLGSELDLIDHNLFKFCWIVDFPFFEWNDEEKKIDFSHNPFSMPQGGIEAINQAKTTEDFLNIKAFQYDIVCNGVELSSGAIRNHDPELMYRAFEIVGYDRDFVDSKFGGMIKAFKFGAPPHGGIAPGVDRIVMLIADEPNIREVIAFPMNQQAEDLLMGAPAIVSEKQLRELNIMHSPSVKAKLMTKNN